MIEFNHKGLLREAALIGSGCLQKAMLRWK